MYEKSFKMISNDKDFDLDNTLSIFEITLSNLLSGKSDINEQDFWIELNYYVHLEKP